MKTRKVTGLTPQELLKPARLESCELRDFSWDKGNAFGIYRATVSFDIPVDLNKVQEKASHGKA